MAEEDMRGDAVHRSSRDRIVESGKLFGFREKAEERGPKLFVFRMASDRFLYGLRGLRSLPRQGTDLCKLNMPVDPERRVFQRRGEDVFCALFLTLGEQGRDIAKEDIAVRRRDPERVLKQALGINAGFQRDACISVRDARVGRRKGARLRKALKRGLMVFQCAFEQTSPLP